MRSSQSENVAEHTMQVAVIAHGLAVVGNTYFGKAYNPETAATLALFHECAEVLTGDLPTPIKYHNPVLRDAYKALEGTANEKLIDCLPACLRGAYAPLVKQTDGAEAALVKAADKLSALIKCIEEEKLGNVEFSAAKIATETAIHALHCEEAEHFIAHFLPAFVKTLDDLFL
jgi:5'-deoxynucleotidase